MLGEILVEQGDLDSSARARLERLAMVHLEARKGGSELSMTVAYQGSSPVDAEPVSPGSPLSPSAAIVPSRGALSILRSHARGGLGEILVALDTELKRQVALKVIQSSHANDPVSQARFVLEAQVTGGLEHPGIVPVYGLGRDAAGRPYYVMRFIEGETLKAAIERFHGREGRQEDHAIVRCRFAGSCRALLPHATRSLMPTAEGWCTGISSRRTSCSAHSAKRWSLIGASSRRWRAGKPEDRKEGVNVCRSGRSLVDAYRVPRWELHGT